jgi:hypothetical protein
MEVRSRIRMSWAWSGSQRVVGTVTVMSMGTERKQRESGGKGRRVSLLDEIHLSLPKLRRCLMDMVMHTRYSERPPNQASFLPLLNLPTPTLRSHT